MEHDRHVQRRRSPLCGRVIATAQNNKACPQRRNKSQTSSLPQLASKEIDRQTDRQRFANLDSNLTLVSALDTCDLVDLRHHLFRSHCLLESRPTEGSLLPLRPRELSLFELSL
ncbi:hypothetical protein Baya_2064 [Bagarius yarrelli]|uniref:Uncharacterized protein n=1 Tax=Bagarius yarrelli TaxID=175774 RepID=A0A556TMW3_BAGYA|nr:hypothetical protein Baya_2064 [Bagarius yarrelli]